VKKTFKAGHNREKSRYYRPFCWEKSRKSCKKRLRIFQK